MTTTTVEKRERDRLQQHRWQNESKRDRERKKNIARDTRPFHHHFDRVYSHWLPCQTSTNNVRMNIEYMYIRTTCTKGIWFENRMTWNQDWMQNEWNDTRRELVKWLAYSSHIKTLQQQQQKSVWPTEQKKCRKKLNTEKKRNTLTEATKKCDTKLV